MSRKPTPAVAGEWDAATLMPYRGRWPVIDPSVWLAPGVRVIGDVELEEGVNVWFNAVIRADVHRIRIGKRTNIQDNTVIHATFEKYPTVIGADVTVGHSAILHACTVEDLCLIGMGSVVMDDVVVGTGSLVAAGTVVSPGTKIPPGSLVVGVPGKVRRPLTPEESAHLRESAESYLGYVRSYRSSE
ncbi:MAG: gamma carbonic anhydrase family protein [Candidatus Wallbacteria bacterium]|nr:gamma carbonic anhydrase family protein [Candidatus Wallbacteria bacterium]